MIDGLFDDSSASGLIDGLIGLFLSLIFHSGYKAYFNVFHTESYCIVFSTVWYCINLYCVACHQYYALSKFLWLKCGHNVIGIALPEVLHV